MSSTLTLSCLLISTVLCIVGVNSLPYYQLRIPNGNRVPNPCDRSLIWQGVGHQSPMGAGTRNPFGLAFRASNHTWSVVCPLDSDGDNRTNGEELGDPNCTWTQGQPFPNVDVITHPGICEPIDSDACKAKNTFLTCPPAFNCSAIQQPDVRNVSIRLPLTKVPVTQTNYRCYGIALPNDKDYHVIALKPNITHVVVDHHIVLYVCKDPPSNTDVFTTAVDCQTQMDLWGCRSLIGVWNLLNGPTYGQCFPNEYGFRIGPKGFRYAVMQIHWNNAYGNSTYGGTEFMDSSGYTIFYTPNLRPNDAAVLITGQESLSIPPGQQTYSVNSTCTSRCTSVLSGPINIATSSLHMHLLGRSGDVLIVRQTGDIVPLSNQTTYNYNLPQATSFTPAIPFQPGDKFQVDCNYNSLQTNTTTNYGVSISDEMCYGFVTYYPANDLFATCNQLITNDTCQVTAPTTITTIPTLTTTTSDGGKQLSSLAELVLPLIVLVLLKN